MWQAEQPKQPDEAVWQAWIKKNQAQDKLRFERRIRVVCLVSVFLVGAALLWTLAG